VSKTATKTRPASSTSRAASRGNGSATRTKSKKEAKTLSAFITERFDEFSRSQKDVARYIVDHLDEAAFQTAEELARRANTSSSTVVRFSQALGFDGYPELQQAAIEEYRHKVAEQAGEGNGGSGAAALFNFDHSEFEASLGADYSNIEETARSLTREQVEASVSAIATSRRVLIVGVEQMAFFASYLRHLLALLDIRTEVVSSPRQDAISRLGRVEDDTLVVSFSAGRAHPLVVRAMKLARHRGARTLSISDATLSDVGEHAELTLYYSSNSPSYSRSNAALLSVVQALAYGVYARDKAAYKDRIRAFKLK
jgi:DNA-binding MurR/RpiR family transcriptional regulator